MRFWDSSALVPLFLQQASTAAMRELFAADPEVLAWTISDVEFRSAICRLSREAAVDPAGADAAVAEFEKFWSHVRVVSAVEAVKERAKRLLSVHVLRAADALQLGAALVATYEQPARRDFVSLDTRLAEAARREGFRVLP
jgi:uncharacterized protein